MTEITFLCQNCGAQWPDKDRSDCPQCGSQDYERITPGEEVGEDEAEDP